MLCFIKIVEINHKRMDSKLAPIRLAAINENEVRFFSSLNLPIYEEVIWRVYAQWPHWEGTISLEGIVVCRCETEGCFEYTVAWTDAVSFNHFIRQLCTIPSAGRAEAIQRYSYFEQSISNKNQIDLLG